MRVDVCEISPFSRCCGHAGQAVKDVQLPMPVICPIAIIYLVHMYYIHVYTYYCYRPVLIYTLCWMLQIYASICLLPMLEFGKGIYNVHRTY